MSWCARLCRWGRGVIGREGAASACRRWAVVAHVDCPSSGGEGGHVVNVQVNEIE